MTQVATIEKIIDSTHAQIAVPRKSACGHDCEECAGCGASGMVVRAVARNQIGAGVGDKVVVQSSTKKTLRIALLVYMLPLALFLVGYFASEALGAEAVRYAVAIASFFLGVLPAVAYDRRVRKSGELTFEIVRLF
ncbi:SoxR reducing system RseC family protein [Oscillibacter sp. MSJ-2]|uniref:SoxR reducing system RseC family protein n=1 Tax=Dysosmobacter acutus TaxID=2841504 RepID=A0ABS6FCI2_9FIRM|nr:SoxR reducing system RseC family protein [Dysosmobacter acutus]MBU5627277.1 SoxR reducing system RseC family protein [Dysosmobacter acutus]